MSNYSCVIPVSWPVLQNDLLPAWVPALQSREGMAAFCRSFVPDAVAFVDEHFRNPFPASFPQEIQWSQDFGILDAAAVLAHPFFQDAQNTGSIEAAEWVFHAAIRRHAAVVLEGADPFESHPYNGCYSRLHDINEVQVAGTKSRFH